MNSIFGYYRKSPQKTWHQKNIFQWLLLVELILFSVSGNLHASSEKKPIPHLSILVPAEPDGGWDLTAKAVTRTLLEMGAVETIDIQYSPGAGGLIGLAQFISTANTLKPRLLVGGLSTVGAGLPNRAAISLLDTSPLARLTMDNSAIAVPVDSDIQTAEDLIDTLLNAPEQVSFVGSSLGGSDQLLLLDIARVLSITPRALNYTPVSGGAEVTKSLLSGRFVAGIGSFSEFKKMIDAGKLRVLAITASEGVNHPDIPSFSELGITVGQTNWRGIFAPKNMNKVLLARLSLMMEKMVEHEEWQNLLQENSWQGAYLSGPEFSEFILAEQNAVAEKYIQSLGDDAQKNNALSSLLLRRYKWVMGLGGLSLLLVLAMYYQRTRANTREQSLQHALEAATGEAMMKTEELDKALAGIQTKIESEFELWGLSAAERDIALLMLKGLYLKEIASSRGTSERTVRQQAQAVYKKSGLENRSDLAAYFIEDFMQSVQKEEAG